ATAASPSMAPRWSTTTRRRLPGMSAKAALGKPAAAQVQAAMPPPRSLKTSRRVVMASPSLELRACDQEREARAFVGRVLDRALDVLGERLAETGRHDIDGVGNVGEPLGEGLAPLRAPQHRFRRDPGG